MFLSGSPVGDVGYMLQSDSGFRAWGVEHWRCPRGRAVAERAYIPKKKLNPKEQP